MTACLGAILCAYYSKVGLEHPGRIMEIYCIFIIIAVFSQNSIKIWNEPAERIGGGMTMITAKIFTEEDLEQIRNHGLSVEAVLRQLEQLNNPPPYLQLVRPCTVGDGIDKIDDEEAGTYISRFEEAAKKGRFLKFVPASGAATRMFRALQRYYNKGKDIPLDVLIKQAQGGDKDSAEFLEFIRGIKNLAFYPRLSRIMKDKGLSIEKLYEEGRFREIVHFILSPEGLGYANMPKALVLFHRYNGQARTAFEEHLVEAANYVKDSTGNASVHFTVADEHRARFQSFLEQIRPVYQKQFDVYYKVDFSVQKKSTDTIAVDVKGRPFRMPDGKLLFRPGGHGALIENLNDLNGDLIFIKNIDNVVPDHLKPETYKWKKILGGLLITLQDTIHGYLRALQHGTMEPIEETHIKAFLKNRVCLEIPDELSTWPMDKRIGFYFKALNRPIRVCGMVKNVGEPGGGPFWVRGKDGKVTRQIVEMAQIDPDSEEQQAIVKGSTHFNPVDLVCGVRNWEGKPFDLREFVDENAVFISQKSKDGKDLKALELPGLWNGAMAEWLTFFVEVPLITFNPVKTVNALLRKGHQPPGT